MDTMSRRKRSRLMARIGPKGTKPEMAVRKALRRLRVGYRCNVRGMQGTPDVVLAKYRLVIFVHGCFWHQHDCPAGTFPSTNRRFWAEKFGRNRARDERNTKELAQAGWDVQVVWECETKAPRRLAARLRRILAGRQDFLGNAT